MAGKKILIYDPVTGRTQQYTTIQSSAGAGNAGDVVALDANGLLAANMMPVGFGDEVQSYPTSDNLAAGQLVNIYSNGGVATARLADGSVQTKPADGFVIASSIQPAAANVYKFGYNNNASGLAPGLDVFLSQTTPGAATTTVPTTAGGISQQVGGDATTATTFAFQLGYPIIEL